MPLVTETGWGRSLCYPQRGGKGWRQARGGRWAWGGGSGGWPAKSREMGMPTMKNCSPAMLGTIRTLLGTPPSAVGTTPTLLGTAPTMPSTTSTALGTTPAMRIAKPMMLGTTPTILGIAPIMPGTTPTMLGTTPPC